jgi:hypothetical protein
MNYIFFLSITSLTAVFTADDVDLEETKIFEKIY